jgi:hypothetical protein
MMGKRREIPIVVMRWFRKGQDLAFHPDVSPRNGDVFRALSEVKTQHEPYRFEANIGVSQLLGEIRPDPICPDERARHRNPYMAVLVLLDGAITVQERELLIDELRRLSIPDEPGPRSELYVTIEERWTIHRFQHPAARGIFGTRWLSGSRPETLSYLNDEEVKRLCRTAELELLDASKRHLSTFANVCAPDCLFWTAEKCFQMNEAQFSTGDARTHVFHVDDRSWEINVRFLGSGLILLASRCRDGFREQINHHFEVLSTPHKLRLTRSDYSLIPDSVSHD